MSSFHERLHSVWKLARQNLEISQSQMKSRYDKRTVQCSFEPGDQVLVLLPLPGSTLHAKFAGPYGIEEKLSETDYVVKTPDRKRKTRVCHVNMLKLYVSRPKPKCTVPSPVIVSVSAGPSDYSPSVDDLRIGNTCLSDIFLTTSETLTVFSSKLSHLSSSSQKELMQLIGKYSSLFSDVPTVTNVLEHDIDVGDCSEGYSLRVIRADLKWSSSVPGVSVRTRQRGK